MAKVKKETVLVGMSGGIDSTVAAYLLKKQGYEVIGIALSFIPAPGEEKLSRRLGPDGKITSERGPFLGVHLVEDLDRVKRLCRQIDIPFYAVNAQKIYQDRVTDFVVAARLGGLHFTPKLHSTMLIVDLLMEKAKLLKADKVATGHYAKVIHHYVNDVFNVLSSNDLENDQSFDLSGLKQHQLKDLLLPLSEMRQTEVQKICEMSKFDVRKTVDPHYKLMHDPRLAVFVEERVPMKMIKPGNMFQFTEDMVLGEHTGIHNYFLGQLRPTFKNTAPVDKDLMVGSIRMNNGHINLIPSQSINIQHLVLKNINFDPSLDISKPLEVLFKISSTDKPSPALAFILNNGLAFIELKSEHDCIIYPGDYLACYNKSGASAKMLFSGEVKKSGKLEQDMLRFLPKTKDELENEKENPRNVDIYAFKF